MDKDECIVFFGLILRLMVSKDGELPNPQKRQANINMLIQTTLT